MNTHHHLKVMVLLESEDEENAHAANVIEHTGGDHGHSNVFQQFRHFGTHTHV